MAFVGEYSQEFMFFSLHLLASHDEGTGFLTLKIESVLFPFLFPITLASMSFETKFKTSSGLFFAKAKIFLFEYLCLERRFFRRGESPYQFCFLKNF